VKLPNPELAIVEIEKLQEYCLNPEHPRGRHKARVFASAVGMTSENAEELKRVLLGAVRDEEAVPGRKDDLGQRYVLQFTLSGPQGDRSVRSVWIVRPDEGFPRLVTCYVV